MVNTDKKRMGRGVGHIVSQETKNKIGWSNKGNTAWNKGMKTEFNKNEKHPAWKGENVSKVGLHAWVKRNKGTPNLCEVCGTITAKKFEWANIDHTYRRVLEDYKRMCTSCHRNYDIEKNNYPRFKGRLKVAI